MIINGTGYLIEIFILALKVDITFKHLNKIFYLVNLLSIVNPILKGLICLEVCLFILVVKVVMI